MATETKKIEWPLAPAPESKDHLTLKQQYELYRRQMDGTEERQLHRHDRPGR